MKNLYFRLALLILLAVPLAAFADEPHVTIDTIQPSGVTADDEFIDLVNPSDSSMPLDEWSIQYKSGAGATYYKKNFPKDSSIGAHGRYRVAGSGYTGTIPADMQQSTISLSAAGGTVFLVGNQILIIDPSDTDIIDQKIYEQATPAPEPTPPPPAPETPATETPHVSIRPFVPDPPVAEKEKETTVETKTAVAGIDYEKLIARVVAEVAKALKTAPEEQRIVIENITVNITGVPPPVEAASVPDAKPKPTPKPAAAPKPTVKKTGDTVNGTVIVAPGTLWKDYFVIETDTEGIQIHLPASTKLVLAVGDIIRAAGTWSTAQTAPLKRLLLKSDTALTIIEHGETSEPSTVALTNISGHLGAIVETSGAVVERQPKRVRIAEGDASLLVPIETGVVLRVGDLVTARGLVVHDGANLKLLPLGTNPVSVPSTKSPPAPTVRRKLTPYAIALAPAALLSTAVYFGRRQRRKGGDVNG